MTASGAMTRVVETGTVSASTSAIIVIAGAMAGAIGTAGDSGASAVTRSSAATGASIVTGSAAVAGSGSAGTGSSIAVGGAGAGADSDGGVRRVMTTPPFSRRLAASKATRSSDCERS